MGDRLTDGLRDRDRMLFPTAPGRKISRISLRLDHDPTHHGDRFAGIKAIGGFRGKHGGIGAVENCVGDVAGFGPRGTWVLDHRFEHLGRGNHWLAPLGRSANHVFLDDRNFLRRHFHAEITARHHYAVGCFKNLFQPFERLRLFQLCDHGKIGAMFGDDLFYLAHIRSRTHERDSQHVDAVLEPKFQVGTIFFRQGRNGERDSRQIDALVFAEWAAVDHFAFDIFAAGANHAQFNQSVVKQNARARRDFPRQPLKSGWDHRRGAFDVARRNRDAGASLEGYWNSILHVAGANLGPLQVLQNADGALFFFSHAAQTLDVARVLFVGPVGEIQPGHVHAQAHQITQDRFRVTGRTDRTDDLCPALCATNVGRPRQCIYGRTGVLRQRLSLFQVCPDQILCRSNYCIWRVALVADTRRNGYRLSPNSVPIWT